MMEKVSDYYQGLRSCYATFMKKMTGYDFHAVKFCCFVVGMLFAFCMPKTAKKWRGVMVFTGLSLMLPTMAKVIGIMREVFGYRRDWE